MSRLRFFGLVFTSIVAVAGLASASALAWEFESSVNGESVGLVASTNVQRFTVKDNNTEAVECETEAVSGTAALKSATTTETIKFDNCSGFGVAATVTPLEAEFKNGGTCKSSEKECKGSVKVGKAVTVEANGGNCKVTVPTAGNSSLSEMLFSTKSGDEIESVAKVEGISWEATETSNGCADLVSATGSGSSGTQTNGKYKGTNTVEGTNGGALKVK